MVTDGSTSWHALANGVVRYVGEAVVAVVAESQAQAVDAAQLVEIEYDELPAAGNLALQVPERPWFGRMLRTT